MYSDEKSYNLRKEIEKLDKRRSENQEKIKELNLENIKINEEILRLRNELKVNDENKLMSRNLKKEETSEDLFLILRKVANFCFYLKM